MFKIKKKKPKVKEKIDYSKYTKESVDELATKIQQSYQQSKDQYWRIHNILYDPKEDLSDSDRKEFKQILAKIESQIRDLEDLIRKYGLLQVRYSQSGVCYRAR